MRSLFVALERVLLAVVVLYPGCYYALSFLPLGGGLSLAGALNVAVVALCAPFVLAGVAARPVSLVSVITGLYVVALGWSVIISPDIPYSARPFAAFAMPALLFLALAVNPWPVVPAPGLLRVALASMAAPVGIALLQAVAIVPPVGQFLALLPPGFTGVWDPGQVATFNRVAGTFAVHVFFAQAVALALLVAVFAPSAVFGRLRWPFVVALGVCLVFTWTRAVWLGVALALAVVALSSWRVQLGLVVGGLGGAALAVIGNTFTDGFLGDQLLARLATNTTAVEDRLRLWLGGVDQAALIGMGLGRGVFATADISVAWTVVSGDTAGETIHNVPVSMWVEGGVVLFVAYLLLILTVVALAARCLLVGGAMTPWGQLLIATVIVVLVSGMTEDNFATPGMLVFWLALLAAERAAQPALPPAPAFARHPTPTEEPS